MLNSSIQLLIVVWRRMILRDRHLCEFVSVFTHSQFAGVNVKAKWQGTVRYFHKWDTEQVIFEFLERAVVLLIPIFYRPAFPGDVHERSRILREVLYE